MSCRMRALAALVFVFSAASSQAVTGPPEVTGMLGESLSVECSYEPTYSNSYKYWCRGAGRFCDVVVQTSNLEQEVRKDRVALRDSPHTRTFTVTMEGLRLEDAGIYQCGIKRSASLDPLFQVTVVVHTASSPLPPTTISVKTAFSLPAPAPSASANVSSITSTTNTGSSGTRSSAWVVFYLLPAGAFLLIVLILIAVLLIRSQRNKNKALDRSSSLNNGTMQLLDRPPDSMQRPAYAVVKKPPTSISNSNSAIPDICYAEMKDLTQETAESLDVTYTNIQFEGTEQDQEVYINMQIIRKDPSAECEYKTVKM